MSIFEFDSNPLIFESRFYVTGLFNLYIPADCKVHTIHHTVNVVQACHELGEHCRLTKTDMEKLLVAANTVGGSLGSGCIWAANQQCCT